MTFKRINQEGINQEGINQKYIRHAVGGRISAQEIYQKNTKYTTTYDLGKSTKNTWGISKCVDWDKISSGYHTTFDCGVEFVFWEFCNLERVC